MTTTPHKQKRCYESHPALTIDGHLVYGGSCSSPIVPDADIYVGLDLGFKASAQAYPWVAGESFLYYIADMHAPSNSDTFKQLIMYLATQIKSGKKVHIGCIGGHGRTGTVLSALVAYMTPTKDAIQYVRDNYCKKAVESTEQIDFLIEHFGVSKVEPSKGDMFSSKGAQYDTPHIREGSRASRITNMSAYYPKQSSATTSALILERKQQAERADLDPSKLGTINTRVTASHRSIWKAKLIDKLN